MNSTAHFIFFSSAKLLQMTFVDWIQTLFYIQICSGFILKVKQGNLSIVKIPRRRDSNDFHFSRVIKHLTSILEAVVLSFEFGSIFHYNILLYVSFAVKLFWISFADWIETFFTWCHCIPKYSIYGIQQMVENFQAKL